MTDHAKVLEGLAYYANDERVELRAAAAELRRLQKLIDDCAPYLWTPDQTPAEALKMWEEDRNRFAEDA